MFSAKENDMNMEGVMLKDSELEMVSGGVTNETAKTGQTQQPGETKQFLCPGCNGLWDFYIYMGGRCVCSHCGYEMFK